MYGVRSYAEEFNHLKLQLCITENSQFHWNVTDFPNFMDPGPRSKYPEKSLIYGICRLSQVHVPCQWDMYTVVSKQLSYTFHLVCVCRQSPDWLPRERREPRHGRYGSRKSKGSNGRYVQWLVDGHNVRLYATCLFRVFFTNSKIASITFLKVIACNRLHVLFSITSNRNLIDYSAKKCCNHDYFFDYFSITFQQLLLITLENC